jgi:hypothetical protein
VDILAFWVFATGKLWLDLERMGTKVISLCLEQIGREILSTVSIKPAESGAESRSWYAEKGGLRDDVSPTRLRFVNSLVEEVIEEEILKIWVVAISCSDVLQED